jgi:hypothetical protein
MNDPQTDSLEDNKELYGHLLAANRRLESTGGHSFFWLLILLPAFLSVGLHLQWLDVLSGYDLGALRSGYVYGLIWLVAFILFCVYADFAVKIAYARIRRELVPLMRRSGYTQYTLLAEMQEDPALKEIAESIKQDQNMDQL